MAEASRRPLVLCLSGHDPTGGAGIQADIEVCVALGAHALSVVTAHTVQDTTDVSRVSAVAPILLSAQLETLLADCSPSACKIGLLGDAAQLPAIAPILRRLQKPIVADPVLRAGGGRDLASAQLQAQMIDTLFPLVDVLTPNAREARRLTGREAIDECGRALLDLGVRNVLITGGDEPGDTVIDWLFSSGRPAQRLESARIVGAFHGAGCTLAAAIAACLAKGQDVPAAVAAARAYVADTLRNALTVGAGRTIPGRRTTR
jgi:hydroxymethylpyrimidine/phosphomethylpyrimidine kinase